MFWESSLNSEGRPKITLNTSRGSGESKTRRLLLVPCSPSHPSTFLAVYSGGGNPRKGVIQARGTGGSPSVTGDSRPLGQSQNHSSRQNLHAGGKISRTQSPSYSSTGFGIPAGRASEGGPLADSSKPGPMGYSSLGKFPSWPILLGGAFWHNVACTMGERDGRTVSALKSKRGPARDMCQPRGERRQPNNEGTETLANNWFISDGKAAQLKTTPL